MEKSNSKAPCRTIYLGDIPLEIAMLPNGDYCLNPKQVAFVINEPYESVVKFLDSEDFKLNWANDCKVFDIEELFVEGNSRWINPISISVASIYWTLRAAAGNKDAEKLTLTMMMNGLRSLKTVLSSSKYN